MAQTFSPYRLAFALVLSVVLVLSVTQLTQAKTAHRQQQYPSQAQAQEAISLYYTQLTGGANTIQHFDSITYRPVYSVLKPRYSNPEEQKKFGGRGGEWWRFDACAQYQFASDTLPKARYTARHLFTFESTQPNTWKVISMVLNGC